MMYLERFLDFFAFEYSFVGLGLLTAVVVGSLCGVVGTFLVLRRMSLVGDAAGHATLPGVCLGFLAAGGAKAMGFLLLGALGVGFLAALLIVAISNAPRTRSDAAIGIVLTGFFGLGVVLLSYIQRSPTGAQSGLNHFIFGNVSAVTTEQFVTIAVLAVATLIVMGIFGRWLTISSFDPGFARASGIPDAALSYGFLAIVTVTVVVSIQAVGVVLVSAMLIIPASVALLLSKKLRTTLIVSCGIGGLSGAVGTMLSFMFEGVATGPAMVLFAAAVFFTVFFFSRRTPTLEPVHV